MNQYRKNIVLCLLLTMLLLPIVVEAQTNTLDSLRQTFQKQEVALIDGYGKALDSRMADLKQKGDLDSYLVVETEKKRFGAEKSVPFPSDAKEAFKSAAGGYFKARVDLMKRYLTALDNLVKTEMRADRIDGAKEAKTEKEKITADLADFEAKKPRVPMTNPNVEKTSVVVEAPKPEKIVPAEEKALPANYPSLAGTWIETRPSFPAGGAQFVMTQTNGNLKYKGSFPPPFLATFEGEGTVSESGKMELKSRFIKVPQGWRNQSTHVGQLSEDGATITGKSTWEDGSCDSVWNKATEKEGIDAPAQSAVPEAAKGGGKTNAVKSALGTWQGENYQCELHADGRWEMLGYASKDWEGTFTFLNASKTKLKRVCNNGSTGTLEYRPAKDILLSENGSVLHRVKKPDDKGAAAAASPNMQPPAAGKKTSPVLGTWQGNNYQCELTEEGRWEMLGHASKDWNGTFTFLNASRTKIRRECDNDKTFTLEYKADKDILLQNDGAVLSRVKKP